MWRQEEDDGGPGDDQDLVEFGSSRPRPRWWLPVAAAALVAVPIGATVVHSATPSSSRTPAVGPSVDRLTEAPATGPRVTELRHRLLGVTAGWELFARGGRGLDGHGEVIRIQLARGRITYTEVPSLQSTGPVSFVVGPDQAVIRPLDFVPGYSVPDGRAAHKLAGPMGGPAIPGPRTDQVWVPSKRQPRRMLLVGLDGHHTGTSVLAATGNTTTAATASDGGGYLLMRSESGVYQVRPSGRRRITTGSVTAAGLTGWLTAECDHGRRCENVLIDRATGARRSVLGRVQAANVPTGVISPGGSTAAVYHVASTGELELHLLDLGTGSDHVARGAGATSFADEALAWSPDGRWLFIAASGRLLAVDARTRRVVRMPIALPPIDQLAVRAG